MPQPISSRRPLRERGRNAIVKAGWVLAPSPRFVVVGTGRSGTKYTAELLTALGIPCGHERVYTRHDVKKQWGLRGDASWLAVPHLDRFKGVVLHQVRDPLAVVRSFVGIGFFTRENNRFTEYAKGFFEFTGDPVIDAMRWYVELNERCERHATFRYRVEDFPEALDGVLDALGTEVDAERRRAAFALVPPNTNTRPRSGLGLADLPRGEHLDRLIAIGERYGYRLG